MENLLYLLAACLLIIGLKMLGSPKTAVRGNAIGAVGMLINFAVAFVVNLFSPPPPQEVQEMVENIHIPTGSMEVPGTH